MMNNKYWNLIGKTNSKLILHDKKKFYKCRFNNGCIDLTRYYNYPFDKNNKDYDKIHICDIDDMINRLKEIKKIAEKNILLT